MHIFKGGVIISYTHYTGQKQPILGVFRSIGLFRTLKETLDMLNRNFGAKLDQWHGVRLHGSSPYRLEGITNCVQLTTRTVNMNIYFTY